MSLRFKNKIIDFITGFEDIHISTYIRLLEEHPTDDLEYPTHKDILTIEITPNANYIHTYFFFSKKFYEIRSEKVASILRNMVKEIVSLIKAGRYNEIPGLIERESETVKSILEEEKKEFEKTFNEIVEKLIRISDILISMAKGNT